MNDPRAPAPTPGVPSDQLYNLIHHAGEMTGRKGHPPVCPREYALYGAIWLSGWRQGIALAAPSAWQKILTE